MTSVPLKVKVTQPAQWQTRVQLRSNDGVRYEINRQILVNRRSVNPIMRYLINFQWFLCQSLPGTKAPVQGW
jgi:hypothetical protein